MRGNLDGLIEKRGRLGSSSSRDTNRPRSLWKTHQHRDEQPNWARNEQLYNFTIFNRKCACAVVAAQDEVSAVALFRKRTLWVPEFIILPDFEAAAAAWERIEYIFLFPPTEWHS